MNAADPRLEHLRWMLLARRLELRLRALYLQGKIAASAFLGLGQEAFSAAGSMHLRRGDILGPSIRDMAGRLAFGETVQEALRVYLGKRTSNMRGRDGNVHRGDPGTGLYPMISHLGSMVGVVGGSLLARRLRGDEPETDKPVGMVSVGDGGMSTGALHEGLNVVAVERLPFVLMVSNNQVAYSTFNDRSFACRDLVDRAPGYGVSGRSCDGEDPVECLRVVGEAVAAARAGEGPQMVVARMLRLSGHGEHDDAKYITPEIRARHRDCLEVGRERAIADGLLDEDGYAAMEAEIEAQIDTEVVEAEAQPDPDPDREDWCAYSERWLTEGLRP